MIKNIKEKAQKTMAKGYALLFNQRGQNNVSSMVWILGGVLLFLIIFAFVKGWIPDLMNSIKSKIDAIL